jgi:hypothetical protein
MFMKVSNSRFLMMLAVSAALFFSGAGTILHASAQPSQAQCPTVRVSCPDSVSVREAITFVVNVSGGDPNVTPTFNWTVSAGAISSGQGTSVIIVDTTEVIGNATVTATVDLGGFNRSCSVAASCTTTVMKKAEARKIDEYGKIRPEDENARLDNFVIELQNDPTAQGYLIAYGGRRSKAGEAKKAAARAKTYLVKKRRLNAQRLATVDGGYREESSYELWLAPPGAQPPQPTPNVDPSEVLPAKPAKRAKAKKPLKRKA